MRGNDIIRSIRHLKLFSDRIIRGHLDHPYLYVFIVCKLTSQSRRTKSLDSLS